MRSWLLRLCWVSWTLCRTSSGLWAASVAAVRGAGRSRGERTRSRTLVTGTFIYIARANQRNRDKHFCRVFAHGPPSLPSQHHPPSRGVYSVCFSALPLVVSAFLSFSNTSCNHVLRSKIETDTMSENIRRKSVSGCPQVLSADLEAVPNRVIEQVLVAEHGPTRNSSSRSHRSRNCLKNAFLRSCAYLLANGV